MWGATLSRTVAHMLTTTPVVDRPHLHLVEASPRPADGPRRPRQWFAAAMVAGGLAFMTAAAGVLTQVGDRDGSRSAPAVDASAGLLALII